VRKQIDYGNQKHVPWGISESCYNTVDVHLTYQYQAFGIPGLGLKRGLGQDLVVAPYATVLALMYSPVRACENLARMRAEGFEGRYGFYESIDYTPVRLSRGQEFAVMQTYMAHHLGMSFLSLTSLLLNEPMQRRFGKDKQFQTALLLLQEQVPKTTGYYAGSMDHEETVLVSDDEQVRVIKGVDTPTPEVQLLSNGQYYVMISNAGGGYSRWNKLAVTRWREDTTCDNWGSFCYIQDALTKEFWSTTHQPTLKIAENYTATFSQGRVEFNRQDHQIETHTIGIVSPEDNVEVRRVKLTNHSKFARDLELTTYGEVVLAEPAADESHPAFSNLFVQTEIKSDLDAIACTRRPRSKDELPPWMFHLIKCDRKKKLPMTFETDRAKFIGRGKSVVSPQAMEENHLLTGTDGSVLDPIVSIRCKVHLQPGESTTVDCITGVAATKDENQHLINKYQDRHMRDRAFELSWTHSHVILRQVGATETEAQLYGKLASAILYINPALRALPGIILKNQRSQSALWSYSISGDLPIVLLQVSSSESISLVKQLIVAQAYWQMKGLAVDLVILNQDTGGYRQLLQERIKAIMAAGNASAAPIRKGQVFVRSIEQVSAEDRILLQAVARVIISDKRGTLAEQINKEATVANLVPKLSREKLRAPQTSNLPRPENLQFFNGYGGFSEDGKAYIVESTSTRRTPRPWINVLANPNFGSIISESGASYTWFQNAHEYRITPWNNDPIRDTSGEVFYLRDDGASPRRSTSCS
jgi:cellobiose phosphorylase